MDKEKQGQAAGQQDQVGEQNPTLNQPGTSVSDYGNVSGGSANENVEQSNESNAQRSGTKDDTVGVP